ncbi:hypothetical protein EJ04DRAFT_557083 [Polyplosphaeria fusca]|uniref:BED-type domain-containing protein n=1 Tax=Polyplosphaeria fusca TaxID=682080 RepID=A0A9P4QIG7_9PLEO|nr:hypothetical protein EJ04DRAFT_557083 [Polyplosphaeria fusca]
MWSIGTSNMMPRLQVTGSAREQAYGLYDQAFSRRELHGAHGGRRLAFYSNTLAQTESSTVHRSRPAGTAVDASVPPIQNSPAPRRSGLANTKLSADLDPILDTIDDSDRDSDSPVEEPPEPSARRRQPPKRTRIVDFDYSWVQWDRIPGFMADARLINRISAYWLYGVPIQLKEGGPNKYRYLCKDCHLNKVSAVFVASGGGSIRSHIMARHRDRYSLIQGNRLRANKCDHGLPDLIALLDPNDPVQQAVRGHLVID